MLETCCMKNNHQRHDLWPTRQEDVHLSSTIIAQVQAFILPWCAIYFWTKLLLHLTSKWSAWLRFYILHSTMMPEWSDLWPALLVWCLAHQEDTNDLWPSRYNLTSYQIEMTCEAQFEMTFDLSWGHGWHLTYQAGVSLVAWPVPSSLQWAQW